jgi:hypothetical protein
VRLALLAMDCAQLLAATGSGGGSSAAAAVACRVLIRTTVGEPSEVGSGGLGVFLLAADAPPGLASAVASCCQQPAQHARRCQQAVASLAY